MKKYNCIVANYASPTFPIIFIHWVNGSVRNKLKVLLDSFTYEDTDGYGKKFWDCYKKSPFSKPISATYEPAVQVTLLRLFLSYLEKNAINILTIYHDCSEKQMK